MARISFNHPYINVTLGSVDKATGVATSVPEHKPGFEIRCDSGVYAYQQAASTIPEGYMCRVIRSGTTTSNWNATPTLTADVGAQSWDLGANVTSGGLVNKQWGWFWLGEGEDFVYAATTVTSYSGNLTTFTSAGQVAAPTSGKGISDLCAIDSNTSSGLRLCRSSRLLNVNTFFGSTG